MILLWDVLFWLSFLPHYKLSDIFGGKHDCHGRRGHVCHVMKVGACLCLFQVSICIFQQFEYILNHMKKCLIHKATFCFIMCVYMAINYYKKYNVLGFFKENFDWMALYFFLFWWKQKPYFIILLSIVILYLRSVSMVTC